MDEGGCRRFVRLCATVVASLSLPQATVATRSRFEYNSSSTQEGLVWAPKFKHVGALVGASLESSPLLFNGSLFLMQARMAAFAPDNQPHSFFCVYAMDTGAPVSCPPSSSGFAFQSAIVDHSVAGDDVVWVFGSAWDRAQSSAPECKPWGCGACANATVGVRVRVMWRHFLRGTW